MRAVLCAVGIALATCGCSWQTLGVYKLDINQGNYVTQDQVDRLKVGLSRQQVKTVLGTPLLADPFHANRWDYYFSNVRSRRPDEPSKLTVHFENDKVVSFAGAARPSPPPPVGSTAPPQPVVR